MKGKLEIAPLTFQISGKVGVGGAAFGRRLLESKGSEEDEPFSCGLKLCVLWYSTTILCKNVHR